MMPVREPQDRPQLPPTLVNAPASVRSAPAVTTHAAMISTVDGDMITRGTARVVVEGELWSGRVSGLERPGQVASMYFAGGVRDVVLRLADGRAARAKIGRTSFIAAGE